MVKALTCKIFPLRMITSTCGQFSGLSDRFVPVIEALTGCPRLDCLLYRYRRVQVFTPSSSGTSSFFFFPLACYVHCCGPEPLPVGVFGYTASVLLGTLTPGSAPVKRCGRDFYDLFQSYRLSFFIIFESRIFAPPQCRTCGDTASVDSQGGLMLWYGFLQPAERSEKVISGDYLF